MECDKIRRVRSFEDRQTRNVDVHRRVRSFKTTSKGLINRGDDVKVSSNKFVQRDLMPCQSNENSNGLRTGFKKYNIPTRDTGKAQAAKTENCDNSYFTVFIMGAAGVGKSTIVEQFMTSEYLGHFHLNVCKLKIYFFLLIFI